MPISWPPGVCTTSAPTTTVFVPSSARKSNRNLQVRLRGPHSSKSHHLWNVYSLFPWEGMSSKQLIRRSRWLAGHVYVTWCRDYRLGIIFGELHTLVFGWNGVQGNMLQTMLRLSAQPCLGRQAGFRASLYSKSSGPGFRFSVPRYMTLGQVILPLMTSASQSVNGLNHSPCASDCWEGIYGNYICEALL